MKNCQGRGQLCIFNCRINHYLNLWISPGKTFAHSQGCMEDRRTRNSPSHNNQMKKIGMVKKDCDEQIYSHAYSTKMAQMHYVNRVPPTKSEPIKLTRFLRLRLVHAIRVNKQVDDKRRTTNKFVLNGILLRPSWFFNQINLHLISVALQLSTEVSKIYH